MNPILIVEDDTNINNLLKEAIEKKGYLCIQAYSGTEARLLLQSQTYSLILLDLMLPGISGEVFLQEMRGKIDIPVIVLTAKDEIDSKVDVLLSGADDYITKPFDINEVLARIVVQMRRKQGQEKSSDILKLKEMELNRKTYQVLVKGQEIRLTRQEFRVLELLLHNPERVFSKQEVYDYAWEEPFYGEDKVINVHISNIRKKIKAVTEEEYIETIWGIGFKICK